MSPKIEIDEELFAVLKEHAEPFTDTPNAVLRRLLIQTGAAQGVRPVPAPTGDGIPTRKVSPARGRPTKGRRAPAHALLSQRAYETPRPEALDDTGGRLPTAEAIAAL